MRRKSCRDLQELSGPYEKRFLIRFGPVLDSAFINKLLKNGFYAFKYKSENKKYVEKSFAVCYNTFYDV